MIKLTKVVLINWMYFKKVTLPIQGNCAIVGENGSGKSTIIDAIQMLLLGNKASKFNASANAEKRTLESYVRGAVNTEEKEFLRDGDVITYLALEVEVNGDKKIFGININYRYARSDLSDPKYFYLENIELTDDIFVKDNYPKSIDDFYKEYHPESINTLLGYQNKIKDVLGIKDSKKYFHILSHAIGIKNIKKCNDFVNDFVLEEKTIEIEAIKNNIRDMERLNKTLESENTKLETLKEIVDLGNNISNDVTVKNEYEIKQKLVETILKENEINVLEKNNNELQEKYNSVEVQREYLKKQISKLDDEVKELTFKLRDISPDLEYKRKELKSCCDAYDLTQYNLNSFKALCEQNLINIKKSMKYKIKSLDNLYDYLLIDDKTSLETKNNFKNVDDDINNLLITKNQLKNDILTKISDKKDEMSRLNLVIKNLKENKFTYNPKIEEFKNKLKSSLENKYHEEVEVKYLCEYLEIADENKEWQNAIEGYLNTQRFYIVVPNKYYKDAIRIYHSEKEFYLTRIINGNKIPDFECEENTLSNFISSNNLIALNYTRFILNKVKCAKDIYDLENYDVAVTKDCMHYQNYSLGRLNKKASTNLFIGQNGIKTQLELRQEEYKKLEEEANNIKNDLIKCNNEITEIANLQYFLRKALEDDKYISSIDESIKLFNEIANLERQIKFYESNPEYIEISAKISALEKDIEVLKVDFVKKEDELRILNTNISINEKLINDYKIVIENIKYELSSYDEFLIINFKNELLKSKVSISYSKELKNEIIKLNIKIEKAKGNLESLMKTARNDYSINAEPTYDNVFKFNEELNKINSSIFKYQEKLLDMQKNSTKLFFSEYLSKLYNSIEKAKTDIDNLNNSLVKFKFGNDYYKITYEITDDPNLKSIYEYALKYNTDESDRGIFIDRDEQDKARNNIQNILYEYMYSTDINLNNMIVDYRNYLKFDVLVYTSNSKKSLNKVLQTQSGGEGQVPFYILSGIAFQQTLDFKRNKDSLGIVLYDEAFEKMDSQRIEAMLNYYKDELNIQLILAAPGKLDSLVYNVETILAVIREGETAVVTNFDYKK